MPFDIETKLIVAVSSSALFDMQEADQVFKEKGETNYRQYQTERLDTPFQKGVAFPFISRLLGLNKLLSNSIEVVVLSRNDSDTGRRFFRTCKHYELNITRGAFLRGKSPHEYIRAFNASLFLSAREEDVKAALEKQFPAGLVLPMSEDNRNVDTEDKELRIAFDFDGVLIDDEAEKVFSQTKDLELFQQHETEKQRQPHNPGPLKELLEKIAAFQKMEQERVAKGRQYKPVLRVAIVSARNAPANERLVTTLKTWGISVDETFLLGGIDKARILEVLKPHIFFDDQKVHLVNASKTIPSVHIPFGVTNIANN